MILTTALKALQMKIFNQRTAPDGVGIFWRERAFSTNVLPLIGVVDIINVIFVVYQRERISDVVFIDITFVFLLT